MIMTEKEKRNTAVHEAGHALVAQAAPRLRPGAQGHHHPPRPGAGRHPDAAHRGPAQLLPSSSCSTSIAMRWAAASPRS